MYEATDLLLRRRPLQNDVPAIIWQIGPLETAPAFPTGIAARAVRAVCRPSATYYPARHQVAAIYCAPHPIMPPHILRFAIEDMGEYAAEIHTGFTLYVPPCGGRPVIDQELAKQIYSIEHLRKITR